MSLGTPPTAIQLGLLVLHPLAGPSTSTSRQAEGWSPLESLSCQSLDYQDADQAVLEALHWLLGDSRIGFGGQYRTAGPDLLVRCWVIPQDAEGSAWARSRGGDKSDREKAMEIVLRALRISWSDGDAPYLLGLTPSDDMRMSDVYASIPSPSDPTVHPSSSRSDIAVQKQLMKYERLVGVRESTKLHRYQFVRYLFPVLESSSALEFLHRLISQRSVAKMLQMETQPESIADPVWTAMPEAGREGTFYLNLETFEIRRDVGRFDGIRGGILNEDMGTGKTLMALSLILATLHQPCSPPANSPRVTITTNAHRERTYPFPADRELRSQLKQGPHPKPGSKFPSLHKLCANLLTETTPNAHRLVPRKISHLVDKLQKHERLPAYYVRPENDLLGPEDSCLRGAKKSNEVPKRMLLANTTLVVCPAVIVDQWMKEVVKHLEPGTLTVLRVKRTDALPEIEELMTYDVVIMSVTRFAAEYKQTSVLEQARWKRIFLDEGHIAGLSKVSHSMLLAKKLSIERRWAISGTPAKHLQQGGEAQSAAAVDEIQDAQGGAWSSKEIADVTSLGLIIGNFLGVEPYHSTSAFTNIVTASLRNGPGFGAVARIKDLLASLMVKHRPGVIDEETRLPPLTQRTERLDFHPIARKTYNALIALIVCNLYTSEAEDRDYFLHPENTAAFKQVVANLHLACFWFSSPEMGTAASLRRTKSYLLDRQCAPEVRARLEEAVRHLEIAERTLGWAEWMSNAVSLPFEASRLSPAIRSAWSDSPSEPSAIDTHSLLMLQEANKRGSTESGLLAMGADNHAYKLQSLRNEVSKGKKRAKASGGDGETGVTITAANQPAAVPKKLKIAKPKAKRVRKTAEDLRSEEAAANADRNEKAHLPRPLPESLVTVSRSVKINFVIRTILDSDPSDQFVIFGDSNELGHLTEALDLFEITSCFAGRGISEAAREEALRKFREPEMRVCLLDLKLAARGLNLVTANRMILLSPIWSPDTLAQVVKRIHRIGQTRPTTVQTLVIRGTIEEDIVNREVKKGKVEEEDTYSRAMIKNPRFVYGSDDDHFPANLTVNLVPKAERDIPPSTPPPHPNALSSVSPTSPELRTPEDQSSGIIWVGEAGGGGAGPSEKRRGVEELEGRPKKRRKGVAFA